MDKLIGWRKYTVFVVAVVVLIVDAKVGLGFDDTARLALMGIVAAYMGANAAQHFADALKLKWNKPLVAPGVPSTRPASLAGDVQSIPVDK